MITYKVPEDITQEPLWQGWAGCTATEDAQVWVEQERQYEAKIAAIIEDSKKYVDPTGWPQDTIHKVGILLRNIVVRALIEAGERTPTPPPQWDEFVDNISDALLAAYDDAYRGVTREARLASRRNKIK